MKQLSTQSIVIAGLLVLAFLVGGAGYFMVVSPQLAKQRDLTAQIGNEQAQLTAAQGAGARPVPFRASDLFRLATAMPGTDDMSGILLDLRNLADASSVQLVSVHPSPRIVLPLGYSALPLVVVVNGKYGAIASFLGRLRKDVRFTGGRLTVNGRLFLADQISLAAGTKDILSATLDLDAFDYAAPPPLSATAGAPGGTAAASGSTAPVAGSAG